MDKTFLEEAKKMPTKQLPQSIKSDFSKRGYSEVNRAKVHLDDITTKKLNSIAFTYGNDIFVKRNYANNKDVLSHEMGHVVQQMRVGVSPDSSDTLINNNSSMENQANEIAFGGLDISLGGSFGKSVQRLMSLEEFQKSTSLIFRKDDNRTKICKIDEVLESYNTFVNTIDSRADEIILNPEWFSNLDERLDRIIQECNLYKENGGNRDIKKLYAQVMKEKFIVEEILKIHKISKDIFSKEEYRAETEQEKNKHEGISQGTLIRARYFATHCKEKILNKYTDVEFCKKLQNLFTNYTKNESISDLINMEAYTNSYQELFNVVKEDENAPEGLKTVLNEVMNFAQNIPVSRNSSKCASKYKDGTYGIGFAMEKEDSIISTGSYLHELTHVSVGESFRNTPMFLGLCKEDKYEKFFEERAENARNLKRVIEEEMKAQKKKKSPFTEQQLVALQKKFKYGVSKDKLICSYLGNFVDYYNKESVKVEGIEKKEANNLAKTIIAVMGDVKDIGSNIFVEYDAVINQMLMWCYGWGILKDNPVVEVLDELVCGEIKRRGDARGDRSLENINKNYTLSYEDLFAEYLL